MTRSQATVRYSRHGRRYFDKAAMLGEATFVIAACALFIGFNGSVFFLNDGVPSSEFRAGLRILMFSIYAISLLILLPRARLVVGTIKANWHLALPVLITWMSISWSIDPGVTFRRCLALLLTTLFAVYLCERYKLTILLRLLALTSAGVMIVNLAFAVTFPALGVTPDGAWRGMFSHKNVLGQSLLIAVLVFALMYTTSGAGHALRSGAIMIAAGMLWLSSSRGPVVALIVIIPAALLIWTFKFRHLAATTLGLAILSGTFVIGAFASLNLAGALRLLGREETLTGRTELWNLVWAAIGERPWLGYGYGAFWEATVASRAIWEVIQWDSPNAHNGYLELLLNLGVLGPVAIMVSVLASFRTAVVALINGWVLEGKFCILVTLVLLVQDMNESSILQQNEILWILYLTAAIYAQRAAQDARAEARSSRKLGLLRTRLNPL